MNLFDPNDYKSIEVDVSIVNLTSGIPVANIGAGKDSMQAEANQIQVIELRENGAIFGLPRNSCAIGHNLNLVISVHTPFTNLQTTLTAKVLSVDKDLSPSHQVNIQFVQFVKEDWDAFLKIFSDRQKEILAFFSSVKGEV